MTMLAFDRKTRDACNKNRNLIVPHYLMAAYAYYELDQPIMTDATFDELAKQGLQHWDTIEHQHKHLLSKDMLAAGTFILGDNKWPSVVVGAVGSLLRPKRKTKRKRKA